MLAMNNHIGLTSCTKQKRNPAHQNAHALRARDLYIGNGFVSAACILDRICDDWYVLSAQHGLVSKDKPLTLYDRSLDDLTDNEYTTWLQNIAHAVAVELEPKRVTIIAEDAYVGYLPAVLTSRGIEVERRPRVDIYGGIKRWYIACEVCGMCGPFRRDHSGAVDDAVGHPCRIEVK